jgi:hypothetical protein
MAVVAGRSSLAGMKQRAWSVGGAIVLAALTCRAQDEIESRETGENAYEIVLRSDTVTDVAAGQRQLSSKASSLCKDRPVHFGRYEFSLSERIAPAPDSSKPAFVLKQQIRCGVGFEGQASLVTPNRTGWRPTETDQATVERLTYQYFRAKDFGDYRDAYLLFAPGVIEWERWRDLTSQFSLGAGAVRSRHIRKITWYLDPPSVGPGVFAAVDYFGEFEKLSIQCGYVVWRQQSNNSFVLIREEQNSLNKENAEKMSADELRTVRTKFGC